MRPKFGVTLAALIVGGWALVAIGAPGPGTPDDTSHYFNFIIAATGGALGFMGLFAGISRWVAEPAARKVLQEHIALREKAHESLVGRTEWDAKHEELKKEITGMREALIGLQSSLSRKANR